MGIGCRKISLKAAMAWLIIGGLLPFLVFSGTLVIKSAMDARKSAVRDLALHVDDVRSDLDRQLQTLQQSMFILAGSEALATGDLGRFREQATEVAGRSGLAITLADHTGQLVVTTRAAAGIKLPVAASIDIIRQAIKTGRPAVSNLLTTTRTGKMAVTMAIPVKVAGRDFAMTMDVISVVGLILAQEHLADGAFVAVIDGVGRKIARFPSIGDVVGETVSARTLEIFNSAVLGEFEGATRLGTLDLNSFTHLTAAPWVINFGIPVPALFAPVKESLMTLTLIGAASLVMALAIAGLIGRQVTTPIGLLSEMARRLGRGETVVALPPSGIREVDTATASLIEASAILQMRTAEREEAFAAVAQQMTDRTRLETQLVQSQKLEAVGLLTGGISHDFNNILGAIVGAMEMASDQMGDNAVGRAVLREGIAAAMLGSDLTRRLLAFACEQPLKPTTLNLNVVVQSLSNMLERTLGGQITVKSVLDPALWSARADTSQVSDALLNLSINARDAMHRVGQVLIETANVTIDGEADALDIPPGDYVTLAVTDSGTGMSGEIIARACEPFFTTKEAGKGSGLGLSMTYGFARQSGGTIEIHSVIGAGTTIRLYLPRMSAMAMQQEAALPATEAATGGETILVVDDFAAMRGLTCRLLTSMGYRVLEAESADQALAILDSGVAIDMLFTDIVMPGGPSGPALAREMRLRGRALPVLFTSGYAGSALDIGEGAPANLLAKPYRKQQLASSIRETLGAS